ncbi:MAG: SDR family oxidoreductase, partial [Actinomycetes bacterium]
VELGPKGIRVVNIAPGAVFTPIDKDEETPEGLAKLDAFIPLGAMGQPEQIGAVAAFLASDAGSYITAASITVDGGMMQQIPDM